MRSTPLDMIRIVAMYLVIVVHTFQFPAASGDFNSINLFFYAVAKTCVPLFLLLSGGLLLGKKESISVFFRKRFSKVLLPWFGWGITAVLLGVFIRGQLFTWSLLSQTLQSFWFVVLIACLYIITPVLRPMVQSLKKNELIYFVGLWFLTVSLLPYVIDSLAFPISVDNGLVRQTISYLGIYVGGYLLLEKWKSLLKKSYTFGLSLFGLGMLFTIGYTFYIKSRSGVLSDSYFNFYTAGIVLSAVGLLIILHKLFTVWDKRWSDSVKNALAVISGLSLHIYFLHDILRRFTVLSFSSHHFLIAYSQAFVLFVVTLAILLLARSLQYLRK